MYQCRICTKLKSILYFNLIIVRIKMQILHGLYREKLLNPLMAHVCCKYCGYAYHYSTFILTQKFLYTPPPQLTV